MTNLTQKNKRKKSVRKIVGQIKEKTLLTYPNPSIDYDLENDTCDSGGGCLVSK